MINCLFSPRLLTYEQRIFYSNFLLVLIYSYMNSAEGFNLVSRIFYLQYLNIESYNKFITKKILNTYFKHKFFFKINSHRTFFTYL